MIGVGVYLTAPGMQARAPAFALADLGSARYAQWDAGSGVATSGSSVTSWTDSIGGIALAQATGAAQPTYSATAFNNGPVVLLNGTSQYLAAELVGALPVGNAPCEIWALVDQQAGADAATRRLFGYGGATLQTARTIGRNSGGNANFTTGDGAGSPGVVFPGGFTSRNVVRYQVGTGQSAIALNGGTDSATPASPATGTTRIRLGSHTLATPAQFWQGGISVLLVTAPLSVVQASQLAVYLKIRGGIA